MVAERFSDIPVLKKLAKLSRKYQFKSYFKLKLQIICRQFYLKRSPSRVFFCAFCWILQSCYSILHNSIEQLLFCLSNLGNIYLFKVNKTTSQTLIWCLYCELWTYFQTFLYSSVSVVDFEQENVYWEHSCSASQIVLLRALSSGNRESMEKFIFEF